MNFTGIINVIPETCKFRELSPRRENYNCNLGITKN